MWTRLWALPRERTGNPKGEAAAWTGAGSFVLHRESARQHRSLLWSQGVKKKTLGAGENNKNVILAIKKQYLILFFPK